MGAAGGERLGRPIGRERRSVSVDRADASEPPPSDSHSPPILQLSLPRERAPLPKTRATSRLPFSRPWRTDFTKCVPANSTMLFASRQEGIGLAPVVSEERKSG
ncbi:hypothetical protein KM043_006349 [Ampulex compressa]|nr:hypothetical protein KM043_006349 [Ampulex compressa]